MNVQLILADVGADAYLVDRHSLALAIFVTVAGAPADRRAGFQRYRNVAIYWNQPSQPYNVRDYFKHRRARVASRVAIHLSSM